MSAWRIGAAANQASSSKAPRRRLIRLQLMVEGFGGLIFVYFSLADFTLYFWICLSSV
jgi:hypothetical protein